jgi:hypothetical protein
MLRMVCRVPKDKKHFSRLLIQSSIGHSCNFQSFICIAVGIDYKKRATFTVQLEVTKWKTHLTGGSGY